MIRYQCVHSWGETPRVATYTGCTGQNFCFVGASVFLSILQVRYEKRWLKNKLIWFFEKYGNVGFSVISFFFLLVFKYFLSKIWKNVGENKLFWYTVLKTTVISTGKLETALGLRR